MKQYLLPEDLGQNLLNYLVTKPYQEVYIYLDKLQKLQEHNPKPLPEVPVKLIEKEKK